MGQYYKFINVDKKEFFEPNWFKLMEFSYTNDADMHSLIALMSGKWKGDRVFVVGDYADHSEDPDTDNAAWLEAMNKACADLGIDRLFEQEDGSYSEAKGEKSRKASLFCYADDAFKKVTVKDKTRIDEGMAKRYIINKALGIYIDLANCPADDVDLRDDGSPTVFRVHPLSLLLAMGNGRGGGDFYGTFNDAGKRVKAEGASIIGSWTATSASITFAKQGEEAKLKGLQEYRPDFSELETPRTPAEIQQRIAELQSGGTKGAFPYNVRPDLVLSAPRSA